MRWWFALLVLLAGCLEAALSPCGPDVLCPADRICIVESGLCVSQDQLDACAGEADGAICNVDGDLGECAGEVCLTPICGNRFVEPGEMCDDGNQTLGDGCNTNCSSTEICGNGQLDVTQGEICDDGGLLSGDGCDSTCQPEVAAWRIEGVNPQYVGPNRMVYDEERRLVLEISDDLLWSWSGTRWSIVSSSGLPPRHEWSWQRLVYASDRKTTVLLGRGAGDASTCRVWEWSGSTWTELVPGNPPTLFGDPRATYDRVRNVVLLAGPTISGSYQVWELDLATLVWRLLPLPGATSGLNFGIAFDEARGRAVLARSVGTDITMYEWSGTSWGTPIATSIANIEKWTLTYDPSVAKVIAVSDRVSEWNGASWTQSSSTLGGSHPQPDVAFDRLRDRLVVFGGPPATANELYERQPTGWVAAHTYPVPAFEVRYAYDTHRRRLIQYGHGDATGVRTWALGDDGVWIELDRAPVNGVAYPGPAAIAYDPIRDAVVLQAQNGGTFLLQDTWTVLEPAGTSAADGIMAMVFDPTRRGVVGITDDGTWLLPSDGTRWMRIGPVQFLALPATIAIDARTGELLMTASFGVAQRYDATLGWTPIVSAGDDHYVVEDSRRGTVFLVGATGPSYERIASAWRAQPELAAAVNGPGFYRPHRGELVVIGTIEDRSRVMLVRTYTSARPLDGCQGSDGDGDGLVDCADTDCWWSCTPSCPPFASCP